MYGNFFYYLTGHVLFSILLNLPPLGFHCLGGCSIPGLFQLWHGQSHALTHGRMNYKDTKPYMSAFLSVDLLTDFAAFCLTDFIDWRYIHSWFVFSTQLVNCCPHGRRNYSLWYLCTVAPLLYLLSDLLEPFEPARQPM